MTIESKRARAGIPRFTLVIRCHAGGGRRADAGRCRPRLRRSPSLASGEYEFDGRIYGMRHAEVFTEYYDGPPVVGDELTHLPNLSSLVSAFFLAGSTYFRYYFAYEASSQ